MFVGRIARPVATRGVDLKNHQLVGRKGGRYHFDNLTGGVLTTTQAGRHVVRRHQPGLELRLGRHAALRDFAYGFRLQRDATVTRQVEGIRKAIEYILSSPDGLCTRSPVRDTTSAQPYQDHLLVPGAQLQ
jgi:hypothetical protein